MRRINFAADRLSDIELPGVKSIIERIKARGNLKPADFVDACIDIVGPLEINSSTRQELIDSAGQQGDVRWDTKEAANTSARRTGDTLALIAASREYQFT